MIYRNALHTDCEEILFLNNKYYQAFLNDEKEKGFLKNQFSLDQIQALVQQQEIVVAEFQNKVIGYYLTNSLFETEEIKKRKIIVRDLVLKGKIKDAKYCFLTQAVVDKPYMGKGVAKELLRNLKELVKEKFDFLIGYIDIENLNAKEAHLKSGS